MLNRPLSHAVVAAVLMLSNAYSSSVVEAQDPFKPRPIQVLPSEVLVAKSTDSERWNRVVLLATPSINSGDVERLNEAMRAAATKCSLTLMATLSKRADTYMLREIGVGYSVRLNGRRTTITSTTAAEQGAQLGFIERQVLRGNEKRFAEVKQIAHTSTLAIFDAPTVFSSASGHRSLVMRHLCWIDPASGSGAMLVWLLTADGKIVDYPMRLVPWGTVEDRKIHVDGGSFVFGIPGETAFGLEDLPPGTSIDWTEAAKRLAGNSVFDGDQISALATAMNDAIGSSRRGSTAAR